MAIKDDNTRISVTIPKELYKDLLELAEYEDRSVSNLIFTIVKDYMNSNCKK
ncbi:MAG: ribbon-helix-helix domain-containing protein [Clostridium sp.]